MLLSIEEKFLIFQYFNYYKQFKFQSQLSLASNSFIFLGLQHYYVVTGGHLDVVQLIVTAGADIDSQDNRKVSCLMAAFRKGHIKVVKWMVKHVNQFPSDGDLSRYIATITDKVGY